MITTQRFLETLDHKSSGGVTEVCVFHGGKVPTHVGYYDDPEKAARAIKAHDGRGNIFVTINPAKRDLLARYNNRLVEGSYKNPAERTKDPDIWRDSWFPIDIDPDRPTGISSTQAELDQAIETGRLVKEWLIDLGVPAASILTGVSGNGVYLLIRLPDYEITKDLIEIKQALLNHIADLFDTDTIKIDRAVYNPSRLVRALGTMKVKGENIPERPHRRSRIFMIAGDQFDSTQQQRCQTVDLYGLAVGMIPGLKTTQKAAKSGKGAGSGDKFDMRRHTDKLTNEKKTTRGWNYYDCPACGGEQKLGVNTATGAYSCFHGCTTDQIRDAMGCPKPAPAEKVSRSSQADNLMEIISKSSDLNLFFSPDEEQAYATITVNGHAETYRVNSREFKSWLANLYYQQETKAINAQAM
jgi:hypothetical protein